MRRTIFITAEQRRATHTMLVPVQQQRIMALPHGGAHLSVFNTALHQRAAQRRVKADAGTPGQVAGRVLRHDREGGGTCIAHEHP
jgi:hypothetical protein